MIASFFGMNVPVPWQGSTTGFVYAMVVAMIVTVSVAVTLWRKRMF
jgi:magnesium transporter